MKFYNYNLEILTATMFKCIPVQLMFTRKRVPEYCLRQNCQAIYHSMIQNTPMHDVQCVSINNSTPGYIDKLPTILNKGF